LQSLVFILQVFCFLYRQGFERR